MSDDPAIPRPRHPYIREGGEPRDEAEHYMRCPGCGAWIDKRDLDQAMRHAGPLPHEAMPEQ